jgi:hypothetical protein
MFTLVENNPSPDPFPFKGRGNITKRGANAPLKHPHNRTGNLSGKGSWFERGQSPLPDPPERYLLNL